MVILCPITSNTKEFPTHYLLQNSKKVKGVDFVEYIKRIIDKEDDGLRLEKNKEIGKKYIYKLLY